MTHAREARDYTSRAQIQTLARHPRGCACARRPPGTALFFEREILQRQVVLQRAADGRAGVQVLPDGGCGRMAQ